MTFDNACAKVGRRLPVYLVLDTSESMNGAPILAVQEGIRRLRNDLISTPQALETVWISVITFETQARQVVPLTELPRFIPPALHARGATSMGMALEILAQALDREVVPSRGPATGDYRPLIFLLTDGAPTDSWKTALKALRRRGKHNPVTIVGLGCGLGASTATLQQIADITMKMADSSPNSIAQFFTWIAQSVQVASIAAAQAAPGGSSINLPPPPKITI